MFEMISMYKWHAIYDSPDNLHEVKDILYIYKICIKNIVQESKYVESCVNYTGNN